MSSTRRPHGVRCSFREDDVSECCMTAVEFDATMAERERCAKIAERSDASDIPNGNMIVTGRQAFARLIAKEIRES